jgi:hypothetical protein
LVWCSASSGLHGHNPFAFFLSLQCQHGNLGKLFKWPFLVNIKPTYGVCYTNSEYVSMHKILKSFSRENDKRTLWLLLPHCPGIQNVKHQQSKACIYVIDAVSMVTNGEEWTCEKFALTRIFSILLNSICYLTD